MFSKYACFVDGVDAVDVVGAVDELGTMDRARGADAFEVDAFEVGVAGVVGTTGAVFD